MKKRFLLIGCISLVTVSIVNTSCNKLEEEKPIDPFESEKKELAEIETAMPFLIEDYRSAVVASRTQPYSITEFWDGRFVNAKKELNVPEPKNAPDSAYITKSDEFFSKFNPDSKYNNPETMAKVPPISEKLYIQNKRMLELKQIIK